MSDWAEGSDPSVLDEDAVQDAVRRCVEAGTLLEIFWSTDKSIHAWNPRKQCRGRFYPAGYVEDLLEEVHAILKGENSVIDAETH